MSPGLLSFPSAELLESDDLAETLSTCINEAFEKADNQFKELYGELAKQSGSTAVVCLIMGNKLVTANLGDARAVLCRDG